MTRRRAEQGFGHLPGTSVTVAHDLKELEAAMRDDTILTPLAHVNNEPA